jgi:hypothetical protein
VAIGAIIPPTSAGMLMKPAIRPRAAAGNQRSITRVTLGSAPASPAPNRNRMATSGRKPVAEPVSAVNADHQATIRRSTQREPCLSPQWPTSTSNAA